MLGRVAAKADRLYVFDNTGTAGPTLIARKDGQTLDLVAPGRIPEIDAVLIQTQDEPT